MSPPTLPERPRLLAVVAGLILLSEITEAHAAGVNVNTDFVLDRCAL